MRALESLTPSGSEFVNDVERCLSFVRQHQESRWTFLKKMVLENRQLREELDSLKSRATTNR
jgi:hypothetical protein